MPNEPGARQETGERFERGNDARPERGRRSGRSSGPPVRTWLAGRGRASGRPDERDGARRPARRRPRSAGADPGPPAGTSGPRRSTPASEEDEAARLAVTVAQLEHALAARVRVEQAIGVLAERHRLRPRQAFDLLRSVARSAGVSSRSRRTWWTARPTRCCRCPRNWPGSRPRRASAAARPGQGGSGGMGLCQRGSGGMGPPGRSSGATWGVAPPASTNVGGRR